MSDTKVLNTCNTSVCYEDQYIVLLSMDPYKLFTYWEFSNSLQDIFINEYGFRSWKESVPYLKITNISKNTSYFIRVNDFSDSWYINNNEPNCLYIVDIGRKLPDDKFISLASSNCVRTPCDSVSNNNTACFVNYTDINKAYTDKPNRTFKINDIELPIDILFGLSSMGILGLSSLESLGLSSEELLGISSMESLGLSPENIFGLSSLELLGFSSSEISGLSSINIAKLSLSKLLGISSMEVQGVNISELLGLSSINLTKLNLEKFFGVSSMELLGLSSLELQEFNSSELFGLSSINLGKLNFEKLFGISSMEVWGISSLQFYGISSLEMFGPSSSEINGVSSIHTP